MLLDFAVESKPKQVTFGVRLAVSLGAIQCNYELNNTGPFSANPESGIVVVTVVEAFCSDALVIPTDFFVGFKPDGGFALSEGGFLSSKNVPWPGWENFAIRVQIDTSLIHVFHTQVFLLGGEEQGTQTFKVYDFSPYTRMKRQKGEIGGYDRCGSEVTSPIPRSKLAKPLATTCHGSFNYNPNTSISPTEDGVLLLTVGVPVVTKRTRLLTRFLLDGAWHLNFSGLRDPTIKDPP